MSGTLAERRHHFRTFFKQDKIIARFILPATMKKSIVVQVLNISSGGIFFTWRSQRDITLRVGDHILFQDIRKGDTHILPLQIPARVVWVSEEFSMDFTGVGSKFADLSAEQQVEIDKFIEACKQLTSHTTGLPASGSQS